MRKKWHAIFFPLGARMPDLTSTTRYKLFHFKWYVFRPEILWSLSPYLEGIAMQCREQLTYLKSTANSVFKLLTYQLHSFERIFLLPTFRLIWLPCIPAIGAGVKRAASCVTGSSVTGHLITTASPCLFQERAVQYILVTKKTQTNSIRCSHSPKIYKQ